MRGIEFRARRTDNGEWVYGHYFKASAESLGEDVLLGSARICHCILTDMDAEEPSIKYYVDGEAVSQFTGLTDKNGVKIFEGDVIRTHIGKHFFDDLVTVIGGQFGVALWAQLIGCNTSTNENLVGKDDAVYTYEYKSKKPTGRKFINSGSRTEIIGNIHENPRLLEATQ